MTSKNKEAVLSEGTGKGTNSGLKEIIKTLEEFEDFVAENSVISTEEELKIIPCVKIAYRGSKLGRYLHTLVNGRFLTDQISKFGSTFFYHGDCFAKYKYMTRRDALYLIEHTEEIKKSIENIKKKIEEENKKLF